jgi:S-DNA-T family DNA segregation ATPase FtsK/SpoIIIE
LRTGQKALELAPLSTGGGYIGAATGGALVTAFGFGGAAIGLACWLIIALALTMDITIGEMLRGLWAGLGRFQDWLIETIQERQSERSPVYPSPSGYPEYKPPGPHQPGSISTMASHTSQPTAKPFAPATPIAGQGSPAPQWVLPSIEQILDEGGEVNYNDELDLQRARLIEETLASFGAPARVVEINRGPTITQFGSNRISLRCVAGACVCASARLPRWQMTWPWRSQPAPSASRRRCPARVLWALKYPTMRSPWSPCAT